MIRRWIPALAGIGIVLWVAALALLAITAEGSQQFGRLQPWILLVNFAGVVVLVGLIGGRFSDFLRDWRGHVPGSRLRGRTLMMFGGLALAPLLLVFAFSILFLTRGIDSWFHAEVRQGLADALDLSRAALDLRMREYVERTERMSEDLESSTGIRLFGVLDNHRRLSGADELMVISSGGQVLAYSATGLPHGLPGAVPEELMLQVRQGRPYVSLEPTASGGYLIRAASSIGQGVGLQGTRTLVAVYPVPQRLADLAETVQLAYQQYGRLSFLREPLKLSFVLTLSLVLLVALLAAMYGALYFSERLIRPVQDLIAGTRAVAKGDFDTRLALPSRDEIGYLVTSFNDMTKRLARARQDAEQSRADVEAERTALAVILARLSSGVISLEPDLRLKVANQAASQILGVDFSDAEGQPLRELAEQQPLLGPVYAAIQAHRDAGEMEWREQLAIRSEGGRRDLVCACTTLPGESEAVVGLVLVFEDVTELLRAQREGAWGEVARRLAHEIRNPLTPIQLSAERLRRKLHDGLSPADADLLERSTHTIVQQVEAMKQMVAAFSEYAKAPDMQLTEVDFGVLIHQAVDLFHVQEPSVILDLDIEPSILIEADRGRLRQLLNNLLTNSLEALAGHSAPGIRIEARRSEDQVVMVVTDNGPGFAPELIGQVFDPYVTSKPKGTGLGLAIVRKIVEEHGGQVDADNAPEGGARVRLSLPAVAREVRRNDSRRDRQ